MARIYLCRPSVEIASGQDSGCVYKNGKKKEKITYVDGKVKIFTILKMDQTTNSNHICTLNIHLAVETDYAQCCTMQQVLSRINNEKRPLILA